MNAGNDQNNIWKADVAAEILSLLSSKYEIEPDPDMLAAYSQGRLNDLLAYPDSSSEHTAAVRYLIAAASQSRLHTPDSFYQIFESGRAIFFAKQILKILDARAEGGISGLDGRVDRLFRARRFDEFESILFECAVAIRYQGAFPRSKVSFVEEGSSKTPDLIVQGRTKAFHVECKKLNRSRDSYLAMQRLLQEKARDISTRCQRELVCYAFNIEFTAPLDSISDTDFTSALEESMAGRVVKRRYLHVQASKLPALPNDNWALDPSPSLYTARYGYPGQDAWHGITRIGDYVKRTGCWLDRITWECVMKWRLSEQMHEQSLVLNFRRVKEALEQFQSHPGRNVVHVHFERSPELGHRAMHLEKFIYQALELYGSTDNLEWYVFNETEHHVNEENYFTFSEHAHFLYHMPISLKKQTPPRVTNVFAFENSMNGLFGIGVPR